MARQREPEGAAPPPLAVAEAPPPGDKDAQIAALERRNAEIEARLAELSAAAVAAGAGPPREARPGVYRVSLSGAPCFRTTAHVEPKEARFSTEELKGVLAKLGKQRTAAYDCVELYCAGRKAAASKGAPQPGLDQLARERYVSERNLELDPLLFRVRVIQGEPVDALEIPADSPWEAEAIFKGYMGITASTAPFTTTLAEKSAGKPAGEAAEPGREGSAGGK